MKKKTEQMNFFSAAQFNYCTLIWMIHRCFNNNRAKYLHERCLRLMHSGKATLKEVVLEKDGSVSIHHKKSLEHLQLNI